MCSLGCPAAERISSGTQTSKCSIAWFQLTLASLCYRVTLFRYHHFRSDVDDADVFLRHTTRFV